MNDKYLAIKFMQIVDKYGTMEQFAIPAELFPIFVFKPEYYPLFLLSKELLEQSLFWALAIRDEWWSENPHIELIGLL